MSAHMSARSEGSGATEHSLLSDAINTKILCATWSLPSMALPISRQCLLASGRRPPLLPVRVYYSVYRVRATVGTYCALDPGFLEMGSICLKAEGVALLILSQFHRIFKNGDREGVRANPLNPIWIRH